jgi:hypothetical protein
LFIQQRHYTAHCAESKQIKKGVFLTGKVALLKKAPELAGGGG